MAKKLKIDAKDLELMKDWFSKPEEQPKKIVKKAPQIKRKPRITAPVRAYIDNTGENAFDTEGNKTQAYTLWFKTEWPDIKAQKTAKTKGVTTTTTTITKRTVTEQVDLTLLIEENVKALKDITLYLRSMDNSLQNLTKGPVKVEIVK